MTRSGMVRAALACCRSAEQAARRKRDVPEWVACARGGGFGQPIVAMTSIDCDEEFACEYDADIDSLACENHPMRGWVYP